MAKLYMKLYFKYQSRRCILTSDDIKVFLCYKCCVFIHEVHIWTLLKIHDCMIYIFLDTKVFKYFILFCDILCYYYWLLNKMILILQVLTFFTCYIWFLLPIWESDCRLANLQSIFLRQSSASLTFSRCTWQSFSFVFVPY